MKSHLSLPPILLILLLAPLTTSLSILLPLYLYPTPSPPAWADITTTITAHPTVQWTIIINPSTGPGPAPFPDSNYITALAALHTHANVHTVGYVEIHDTNTPLATVQTQIDTYANWATYKGGGDISVGGVFFDDTSNKATEANYAYMQTVAGYAKGAFKTSTTTTTTKNGSASAGMVVCNPGSLAPVQLFADCDLIVESEVPLAQYGDQTTLNAIPAADRGKSAVMVNTVPAGTDVKGLVGRVGAMGLAAVWFGEDCCYNSFAAEGLEALAEAVMAA